MHDDELHADVLEEHAVDLFADAVDAYSGQVRRSALDPAPYLARHQEFAAECRAAGKVTPDEVDYSISWLTRALKICAPTDDHRVTLRGAVAVLESQNGRPLRNFRTDRTSDI